MKKSRRKLKQERDEGVINFITALLLLIVLIIFIWSKYS